MAQKTGLRFTAQRTIGRTPADDRWRGMAWSGTKVIATTPDGFRTKREALAAIKERV